MSENTAPIPREQDVTDSELHEMLRYVNAIHGILTKVMMSNEALKKNIQDRIIERNPDRLNNLYQAVTGATVEGPATRDPEEQDDERFPAA